MEATKVLAVLRALSAAGVRYKVVGGVALNLHGIVRATEDLDLFVAADPENVSRLRAGLTAVFADPHIEEITAEDLAGDYPAIQYVPPDGSVPIDLLARLGTAFGYDDIEAELRQVEDIPVWVATPKMLYRMKKDTVRLQDRADAERLRLVFELEDD
jgi:hypothetical protein